MQKIFTPFENEIRKFENKIHYQMTHIYIKISLITNSSKIMICIVLIFELSNMQLGSVLGPLHNCAYVVYKSEGMSGISIL